ncbi:hypothetical protein HC931_18085 [Candidatus Gracilibacteria bacterium]|nr:hypothetical protein [Candidatus Gracilibacteria bacterium]
MADNLQKNNTIIWVQEKPTFLVSVNLYGFEEERLTQHDRILLSRSLAKVGVDQLHGEVLLSISSILCGNFALT